MKNRYLNKSTHSRFERKHFFKNKNVSNAEVNEIAESIKKSLRGNLVEKYETSKTENRLKEISTLLIVVVILAVCFLSECN